MMLSFSLPTFLRLCHLDQVSLVNEISKKMNPGAGHDYYWSLKKAINLKISGASKEEIDFVLESPTKPDERKYNQAAYENFQAKYSTKKSIQSLDHLKVFNIAEHEIEIRVEPWFSTVEQGEAHLHVVYPSVRPKLAQRNAAIGCHITRQAFKDSSFGNARFCVLDIATPKRFKDSIISPRTELALDAIAASIRRIAKSV